ncbi:MAG: L-threonylcarbamoyladenylate synthase [Pseudomonadota bacterium]
MDSLECPARDTEILSDTPANIEKAAEALRAGELVAFATETVYGLGADATDDQAVARLFAAKGRPRFNPLISHIADDSALTDLAEIDERADTLAETLWPGPLTLVLPRREGGPICDLACAGLATVAVRMPAHPTARALISAAGRPIAAPSANRSGAVSATTVKHVMNDLAGQVRFVLASGRPEAGIESTIIDLTDDQPRLLRPGAIPREDIEALIGPLATGKDSPDGPRSPGRLASHYAPRASLRLSVDIPEIGEAYLAFGPTLHKGDLVLNLSEKGDMTQAAGNLYAMLRSLDELGVDRIAVAPIPQEGLGDAINDRLQRAAAPRPA